jgi:hypothetical protein
MMAAPVITSVTPSGAQSFQTGTSHDFTVVAQDADARVETLQITGKDAAGNLSAVTEVPLTWTDPVTITAKIKETGSPTVVNVVGNKVTVAG